MKKGYNPRKHGRASHHPLLAVLGEPISSCTAGCGAGTRGPTTLRRESRAGERRQRLLCSGLLARTGEAEGGGLCAGFEPGRVLNRGGRLRGRARDPVHRRMRRKLRSPAGRAIYGWRKALIEPVFGVLKEQRGMRQFRCRGLEKVQAEWSLATTAYNLTRMWRAASQSAGQARGRTGTGSQMSNAG